MLILGIDPGLTKTNPLGLALVDTDTMKLVAHWAVEPESKGWQTSLEQISETLYAIGRDYFPDAVAFEAPHVAVNPRTAIKLAYIGGIAVSYASDFDSPWAEVSPTQAKVALAGKGSADKRAMQLAAKNIFNVDLDKDSADAVGIALAGEAIIRKRLAVEAAS